MEAKDEMRQFINDRNSERKRMRVIKDRNIEREKKGVD